MTWYPTHVSLINHIRYSTTCRLALFQRGAFAEREDSINSRVELRVRPLLRDPPIRASGPCLPSGPGVEDFPAFSVHQMHFLFAVRELFLRTPCPSSEENGVFLLRQMLLDSILHQNEIEQVLLYWWQKDLVSSAAEGPMRWADVVQQLMGKLCASFFIEDQPSYIPHCTGEEFLEKWLQSDPVVNFVQRPLKYRPIMMGHLFSGHRRPQDLQEALESLELPREHSSMVMSIDIIFSEVAGNLLNPTVFRTFQEAIFHGMLIILYAGPPCETWSRARLRGWLDGGPKPVRSVDCLQGSSPLSLREAEQVNIGNRLLGVAVQLATLLMIYGGMFVLEHPAIPPEPHAPAIWKVPALQFLRSRKQAQFFTVQAGHFGSPSAKPTAFLVLNGPEDSLSLMLQHRVCNVAPSFSSIGRGQNKQWLTAVLKEYPPAMCRGLARLALEHLRGRQSERTLVELPEATVEKFQSLVVAFNNQATMGPDFHPVAPSN